MKPQRISSKDYEELLKSMRRWPDPYRAMVAKLIGHITYQFDEIKRLDDRLRKLEQTGLEEARNVAQVVVTDVGIAVTKPQIQTAPKVFLTTGQILKGIAELNGTDSTEWRRALKYKAISHDDAIKLITAIDTT